MNNPPHVIVGTPGRTLDMVKRGKIKLENVEIVFKLRFDLLNLLDKNVPFEKDLRRVFDIGLRLNFNERNSDKRFVDLMLNIG